MSTANRPMRSSTPSTNNRHNRIRGPSRKIRPSITRGRYSSKSRRRRDTNLTSRVRQRQTMVMLDGPRRRRRRPYIPNHSSSSRPPKSSPNSTRYRSTTSSRRTINSKVRSLPSLTRLVRNTHSSTIRTINSNQGNRSSRYKRRPIVNSRPYSRKSKHSSRSTSRIQRNRMSIPQLKTMLLVRLLLSLLTMSTINILLYARYQAPFIAYKEPTTQSQ